MKYLLDTHSLSSKVIESAHGRKDLCVIEDVLDESSEKTVSSIKNRQQIEILSIGCRHLKKLGEILKIHGANFKLIRLYTDEGTADVMMLAYVLSERDEPETLFSDKRCWPEGGCKYLRDKMC